MTTVLSLKQKIVGDSGVDVSAYKLEFNDKVLEDLKTFGEYGIINGSNIKLKPIEGVLKE